MRPLPNSLTTPRHPSRLPTSRLPASHRSHGSPARCGGRTPTRVDVRPPHVLPPSVPTGVCSLFARSPTALSRSYAPTSPPVNAAPPGPPPIGPGRFTLAPCSLAHETRVSPRRSQHARDVSIARMAPAAAASQHPTFAWCPAIRRPLRRSAQPAQLPPTSRQPRRQPSPPPHARPYSGTRRSVTVVVTRRPSGTTSASDGR